MHKLLILINLLLVTPLTFANSRVGNFNIINPQSLDNSDISGTDLAQNITISKNQSLDLFKLRNDPSFKIIHSSPSINGSSRLSIGRINNNQWQIQSFELPSEQLINSEFYPEIQKSIEINNWVEVQK